MSSILTDKRHVPPRPALQHFYVCGQYFGGAVPRSHRRVVAKACTWNLGGSDGGEQ